MYLSVNDTILLGTNSSYTSIGTEEVKKLKELGLDKIVFDFQAGNVDVYNQIMGTNNYYAYLASSLIKATSNGLSTDVHYIPTKINYKELPEIIELLNIAN